MIKHHPVADISKGFTLLETVIYIALFSILITGVIVSAYSFFRGAEILSVQVLRENESMFVTQKVGALLNKASVLSAPFAGSASSTLRFSTQGGVEHRVTVLDGSIVYATGTNPYLPLTSERIHVTSFSATHTAPTGASARFLDYSFIVDGEVIGPVRTYFTF